MRFARTYVLAFFSVLALTFSLTPFALAQVPDPVVAAEAPRPGAGHHYIGNGTETVNPADGSLSFHLPLQPPAGRGLNFTFGVRFAGTEQYFLKNWPTNGTLQWFPNGTYGSQPLQLGAWSYDVPLLTASTSFFWSATTPNNGCPNGFCTYSTNYCFGNDSYVFRGLDGNQFSVAIGSVFPDPNNFQSGFCPASPNNLKGPSNQHGVLAAYQSSSVTMVVDPSGTTYQFPTGSGQPQEPNTSTGDPAMWGVLATSITDRNGNQLVQSGNGYKDSTGRTAISWSGIGSSNGDQINIAGLGPVTVKWTTTPVSFPETGYNLDPSPNTCSLSGAVPGSSPIQVVSEIDLPNGQKYTFQYDGTYGKVSKITFPDGGYVRYVWGLYASGKATHASWSAGQPSTALGCDFIFDAPAVTDRYVSFDGTTEVLHQQFSYALPNWSSGGPFPAWSTRQTTVTSTDLLTSQITKAIYTYAAATTDNNVWVNGAFYSKLVPVEASVVYQDGAGKTYKEVDKTWLNPHVLASEQTILYDSSGNRSVGSGKVFGYDANEQVTGISECGFQTEGSSSGSACNSLSFVGPLRRQTTNVYYPFFTWNGGSPPTWSGTHIVNAPQSITVADGSGATAKQSLYFYDQNALQSSGAINLTNPGTTRANITTLKRLISSSTYATTRYTYYDTGQPYTMTDPCGNTTCSDVTGSNHTTTYSYTDNYASGTGTPPGQTFAYLTQVTHPPTANATHTEKFTWGYNDGLIRSHIDVENNLITSYAYADPLLRLTQIVAPDGGQTNVSYNDTAPSPKVTTSKQINASQTLTTVSVSDGMGHVKQTQLTSDPQGTVYTDTTLDGFGRVWKQSNPYRTGTDITTTTGTTILAYDVVGRKLTETYPDNSVLATAYCGASTLVTDPTGHWRRSRTDGLGFLVEVDEPNATGVSVNACPGTGEPIWVTSYGYDTLGNLTSVLQNGSHSRSFTHDSLSRMLTSNNPEVGIIMYSYDANSNVYTKTDARNLTTTYGYDVLNRPLRRTYSNNDPSVSITYDQSNCLNLSACQNVGQRTSMTDAAGSESWAYQVDSAHSRSVHEEKRTTNSITKRSTYYFDLAGNVTRAIYPTGRTVNYTFDAASRPSVAIDGSNGITYATGFETSPGGTCAANVTCYTPQGAFYALSIGQTSSFAGLNLTHIYNSRLQPQEFKASSAGGNAIDITYNFVDPVSGKNASHVYGITNNLDTTRSQNFTYDQLNRVTSALTTSTYATSQPHCWGENYTLDTWGNLSSIEGTTNSSYTGCSQESGFSTTADGNNHLPVWAYDAAGNTTSDGFVTNYVWDAESQLKSASGVTYTYDGDGRRVSKSNGKLYWYGSGGDILAETDSSGNTTAEYIFFGGKRVAELGMGTQGSPGTGSATISGSEQSTTGSPATSGAGSVTFSGSLQSKQVQTQAGAPGTGSVTFSGTLQSKQISQPATSGSGSVTFSGSLQSKQVLAQAAISGTGSVTFNGALQSTQVQTQSAAPGTGSVTISGGPDQSVTFNPCAPNQYCPQTIYDGGSLQATVNGFSKSAGWGSSDTVSSIASALANAFNSDSSSPVTASASNGVVTFTAKTSGSGTNYSLSASVTTWNTQYFSSPSFSISASGSSLTGGRDATYTTVYDSGTCTITVNSHGDSATWSGSGTTSSSIAAALVSSINGDGSASVSASPPSGSTVNLTAKTGGSGTNYSLSSSCSYDSSHFSSPSFTTANSGSALTGGKDAVYNTVYDSGTSTITVNGHADSVSWSGSGTTTSSVASGLASAINADSAAPVTASASGSAVNLLAKTTGASTNYSLSSASTYDSTDFPGSSFSSSNSGSSLTGGQNAISNTIYDSGTSTITVNGHADSVSWSGSGTTSSSIASALASNINGDSGAFVTAAASGSTINLTAKTTGASTNYSLSSSWTYDSSDFSSSSFTASNSGSALIGGKDAVYTTVYDSGTSTITVNGHADSVSWSGSGTTSSSIASSLASNINADSGASVTASASGSKVNLTAKTTGASTNYTLSSASTYDSTDFSSASFSSSNSGSTLTGGQNAGTTTYDSGTAWITINNTQYSVSYGQGSSSSSVASALTSAISAGSLANASASGSGISLTAKTTGAATNYSLSSGSSTSQPGTFSSPSFSISVSGSALTGGKDATQNVVNYYVEDMLGTSRVLTTNTGVVCYDADFYPFGGERAYTNTCPQNYKFEGKERDTETGNDDFGARYYSNRFGRWLSADWSAVPAPVPYANLTNPQTLNLYAMVADDPESFVDLDGHDPQNTPVNSSPECKTNPSDITCAANQEASAKAEVDQANQQSSTNQAAQQNSAAQFVKDEAKGMAKEAYNTLAGLDNWVYSGVNAALGTNFHVDEYKPATPGEKSAMLGTSVALLLMPGSGETKALSKGEKISQLTADAEKLYPKLAGKPLQDHHIIPKYLGGAKDGATARIPAAYHQLITNEFRRLAPYGQSIKRSAAEVGRIAQQVYSKFPLP